MGHRSARLVHSFLAAAVLLPKTGAGAQAVRDSGGVQIVENRAPGLSQARAWRIAPQPIVTIGGQHADSDTLNEIYLVMGITRLSDGRLAVGVQASHAVRFYDARGRHLSSAGRRGQGPGEFRQIMGVWSTRGDTLVVLDNGELEIFTGAGNFVMQGASRTRGDRFVYPSAVLNDGSYFGVEYGSSRAPPPAGRTRPSRPIVHVSRDGQQVDTVGTFLSAEEVFDGRNEWGTRVGFSGYSQIEANDQSFFVASPLRPEINQFTHDGRAVRQIRMPFPVVRTSHEAINAYRDWMLAMPGEDGRPMAPAQRARRERLLEQTAYAEQLPFFGTILADAAGNLWLQRFDYRSVFFTPGPVRTQTMAVASKWDVIDDAGRWITTVDLPARFTPVEIGVDYIAGLARDEDDVEQVRVYRLLKP